jgi:tetratricopeptide (TPR) repeat protein
LPSIRNTTRLAKRQRGDWAGAVESLRRAVSLNPQWLAPCVDLAWMLATSRLADQNAKEEAVLLAERAVKLTNQPDPAVLDTLAVAYAGVGKFDDAIRTSRSALAAGPAGTLADDIRARLALYLTGTPYLR